MKGNSSSKPSFFRGYSSVFAGVRRWFGTWNPSIEKNSVWRIIVNQRTIAQVFPREISDASMKYWYELHCSTWNFHFSPWISLDSRILWGKIKPFFRFLVPETVWSYEVTFSIREIAWHEIVPKEFKELDMDVIFMVSFRFWLVDDMVAWPRCADHRLKVEGLKWTQVVDHNLGSPPTQEQSPFFYYIFRIGNPQPLLPGGG